MTPEEARRIAQEADGPLAPARPLDVVEEALAAARVAEAEQVARDEAERKAAHEEAERRAWERFYNDPTRGGAGRPAKAAEPEPDPAALAEELAREDGD
jgi:fused signal recognition particle receptor